MRRADQPVGEHDGVERDHLGMQPVGDDARQRAGERVGGDRGCRRSTASRGRSSWRRRAPPAQVGLQAAGDHERAPVEGLQQAAAHRVVGADDREHLRRERLRVDRVVGLGRVDLRLDVELDVTGAVALGEVEDLVERRHAGAGDGLLRAHELVRGRVGRVARAAVERLGLREREVLHQLADEVVGAGVLAEEREDARLVGDEDLTVLGDGGVQLERGDAELQRVAERRQRVLGPQPAPAAVGLEVERPAFVAVPPVRLPPAPPARRAARARQGREWRGTDACVPLPDRPRPPYRPREPLTRRPFTRRSPPRHRPSRSAAGTAYGCHRCVRPRAARAAASMRRGGKRPAILEAWRPWRRPLRRPCPRRRRVLRARRSSCSCSWSASSTLGAEIAAARLMAPFFGASTIVWANTIAVVLVALSVGYWFGGRLADRHPHLRGAVHARAGRRARCWPSCRSSRTRSCR